MELEKIKDKKLLALIDGHALIHRAYHAYPPNLKTSDGQLVNAVYGFTSMLLQLFQDMDPEYVVCCFDTPKPTFRHTRFAGYKANRTKPDDELISQFPLVKRVVEVMNIPIFSIEGYEADDMIGTISKQAEDSNSDLKTIIVTGDHDTLQLVDENTFVWMPGKSFGDMKLMQRKNVIERYGFGPERIIDYKALRGDSSDNIPGVKGVGEKTATDLIKEYGDLDEIYKNIDKLKPRYQKLLSENYEEAVMSKELATIDVSAPIKFKLEDCLLKSFDRDEVMNLFKELEFRSLINKIPESLDTEQASMFSKTSDKSITNDSQEDIYKDSDYILADTPNSIKDLVEKIKKSGVFTFDTETDGLDNMNKKVVGISISLEQNEGTYIPVRSILLNGKLSKVGLELASVFSDETILKIAHNAKFDIHSLENIGIKVNGFYFDTMIAAYLASYGEGRIGLKELAFTKLGLVMEDFATLSDTKSKLASDIPVEKIYKYACRDTDATLRLYKYLAKKLLTESEINKKEMDYDFEELSLKEVVYKLDKFVKTDLKSGHSILNLLFEIENPLIQILVDMERQGIKLDQDYLTDFGKEIEKKIGELEQEIYKSLGHEFNLNSPKQLSEVLFEELDLPKTKKMKTGSYSTNETYLSRMKDMHPMIPLVLEYRELYKLKSTYVDSLLKIASESNGRIHTTYNQTIAITGRLSSIDPNLQNIPTRTDLGNRIRDAFTSDEKKVLLGFDYSQQEMRILAHLSNDKDMIEAFNENVDIHTYTASQLFEKDIDKVEPHERAQAKTVNFGIIYGISAYGLSSRLEIPVELAGEFIEKFFESYTGIKLFYEELINNAKENLYAETLLGRRKNTAELLSSN
ncbi:DNA polymerase I, partial [Candidatus Dojkabacteria bacterium]|nr:DNA polymerase I [Candidatus Dojkabacteria bacterium]